MSDPKPYPHSVEIERAFLGGAILHAAVGEHALAPGDFYRPEHGALWTLLLRMQDRGEPIEEVTVTERVHRTGRPDDYGGIAYLLHLAEHAPPSPASLAYYARVVADFAVRRRVLRQIERLADELRAADAVEDVLEPDVAAAVSLLEGDVAGALRALGYEGERERCARLFRSLVPPRDVAEPDAANGPPPAVRVAK